jgi:signal transduction histidine kinase
MQHTYDLQIAQLRNRRGDIKGRLVVVRDITERVRADDERATLLHVQAAQAQELLRREAETAALRQLDRLKSELLATVSHELRTPLTVVHGYAQRLAALRQDELENVRVSERVEQFASRIVASSAQLVRLVEELLDFDRLGRGEVGLHPEPFDVAPLLADVLEGFQGRTGGHTLAADWPARLWVTADRGRLAQVVTNLLENAFRYAGGAITVRATPVGAASGASTGVIHSSVRFEVVDKGPGIAPDEQPLLWERFYRGRGVAGLNVARGSGIGLAVVKTLVEAQGGRVGVESQPGLGSCFWFELPAGNSAAARGNGAVA